MGYGRMLHQMGEIIQSFIIIFLIFILKYSYLKCDWRISLIVKIAADGPSVQKPCHMGEINATSGTGSRVYPFLFHSVSFRPLVDSAEQPNTVISLTWKPSAILHAQLANKTKTRAFKCRLEPLTLTDSRPLARCVRDPKECRKVQNNELFNRVFKRMNSGSTKAETQMLNPRQSVGPSWKLS